MVPVSDQVPVRDQVDLQIFLLDLENWVLGHRWDTRLGVPCGRLRHVDSLWGETMRFELLAYPRRCWDDYCSWVRGGGGDDWFQPAELEWDPSSSETRYRESAMPLPAAPTHTSVNGHGPTTDDLRRVGQAGG